MPIAYPPNAKTQPAAPTALAPVRALSAAMAHLALAAVACTGLGACGDDQVTHARVPKTAAKVEAATPAAPVGVAASPQAESQAGKASVRPAWTVPANWKQVPGSGMRYATLQADAPGAPEITVVMLGGAAGGELANVNRWRGQVGLAPVDEAALAGLRTTVTSKVGPVQVYDFAGQGADATRMLAAIWTDANGDTWFFKTNGSPAAVDSVRPGLLATLETLRLE